MSRIKGTLTALVSIGISYSPSSSWFPRSSRLSCCSRWGTLLVPPASARVSEFLPVIGGTELIRGVSFEALHASWVMWWPTLPGTTLHCHPGSHTLSSLRQEEDKTPAAASRSSACYSTLRSAGSSWLTVRPPRPRFSPQSLPVSRTRPALPVCDLFYWNLT